MSITEQCKGGPKGSACIPPQSTTMRKHAALDLGKGIGRPPTASRVQGTMHRGHGKETRANPIVGQECKWCLRPLHRKKSGFAGRLARLDGFFLHSMEAKMGIRVFFRGHPACRYSRRADRPGLTGPLCVPSSQLVNLHETMDRRQKHEFRLRCQFVAWMGRKMWR